MKYAGLIIIALVAAAAVLVSSASPAQAAAFTVNSTGDASDSNTTNTVCDTGNLNSEGQPECTLRAAIQQANSPFSAGADEIFFNIPTSDPRYDDAGADAVCSGNLDDEGDGFVNDGCPQVGGESEEDLECTNQVDDGVEFDGVVNDGCPDWVTGTFIIIPNTFLDFINDPITIDGRTQSQFVDKPVIQVNGSSAGNLVDGLRISAGGANSTVRGLIINRFGGITGNGSDGIEIEGGGNNLIEGNFIGTDSTGILVDTNPLAVGQVYGNRGSGVFVNGSADNTIGGTRPDVFCVGATNPCNVLSGGGRDESAFSDAHGIEIAGSGATGNVAMGNIIGLDIGHSESGPLCLADLGAFIGGTADDDADTVINDGCPQVGPTAEVDQCSDNLDDDGDTKVNDGCPVAGSGPEVNAQCDNAVDDDGDGRVNDGCLAVTGGELSQCDDGTDDDGDANNEVNDGCPVVIGAIKDIGNRGDGVSIFGVSDNTIGGGAAGEGNVITANNGVGVRIFGGPEAGTDCADNIDDDADGRTNDGCPQVGTVAESGTACNNSVDNDLNDAAEDHSANGQIGWVNDGCPEFRVARDNQLEGNLIGTTSPGTSLPPPGSTKSSVGILVDGAPNNVIGVAGGIPNVASGNGTGIQIQGLGGLFNVVQRNYVGTDVNGAFDLGNQAGILLGNPVAGALNTTIGGTAAGAGNVVSGNDQNGIEITNAASANNVVQGNYVGTNRTGTAAVGNGFPGGNTVGRGVVVNGSSDNTIGGTTAGRNIISGNLMFGVEIKGSTASGNAIQSNYIGTNAAGTGPVGNLAGGIIISGAPNTLIGGTTTDVRNLISGNGPSTAAGILISGTAATGTLVRGNLIGTNFDGTVSLANGGNGVLISGAPGNTIGGTGGASTRNIISGNTHHGVEIDFAGGTGNLVQGNYIGLNVSGNLLGNGGDGVFISSAPGNIVGGTTAGAGNVISDNGATGIHLAGAAASDNVVQANMIGTNAAGTAEMGNASEGVFIDGAAGNTIGGTATAAGNLISGNSTGVSISTETATSNFVQGNHIGTDSAGTGNLGNTFDGVRIGGGASSNVIGGMAAGAGNTIAFNGSLGVVVNSPTSVSNSILSNSISQNGSLGIDLGIGGVVTANDAGDGDSGPNNQQNFPVVSAATVYLGKTTVSGTLNSLANQPFELQFFASPACNAPAPNDHGEGATYLGTISVNTVGSNATFTNAELPTGHGGNGANFAQITATATDQSGNTSEFSQCRAATINIDQDGDAICDPGASGPGCTGSDNCPAVPNGPAQAGVAGVGNQTNSDVPPDSAGDACDLDDDNDKVADVDEQACGGNRTNASVRPERVDGIFAGVSDDGDGQIDEALPPGSQNFDCDGDGFKGIVEEHVYSLGSRDYNAAKTGKRDQDPCGVDGWPAEINSSGLSANKLDIQDLASFIAPVRRLNTTPGDTDFNVRWDIVPGAAAGDHTNVSDLAAMTSGPTSYPPMFAPVPPATGGRAFGQTCPWAP